jgi:hypothetical protein
MPRPRLPALLAERLDRAGGPGQAVAALPRAAVPAALTGGLVWVVAGVFAFAAALQGRPTRAGGDGRSADGPPVPAGTRSGA